MHGHIVTLGLHLKSSAGVGRVRAGKLIPYLQKERGESYDTPQDAPAWPPAKNTKRAGPSKLLANKLGLL